MEWRRRARDVFWSTLECFLGFESIFNDELKTTANDFVNHIARRLGVRAIILRSTSAFIPNLYGFYGAKSSK